MCGIIEHDNIGDIENQRRTKVIRSDQDKHMRRRAQRRDYNSAKCFLTTEHTRNKHHVCKLDELRRLKRKASYIYRKVSAVHRIAKYEHHAQQDNSGNTVQHIKLNQKMQLFHYDRHQHQHKCTCPYQQILSDKLIRVKSCQHQHSRTHKKCHVIQKNPVTPLINHRKYIEQEKEIKQLHEQKHDKQKILPVHKENNIPKHCHTDDYYNLNYSFSLLPLFTPLFIKDMSQKSVQAENSPQQYKNVF